MSHPNRLVLSFFGRPYGSMVCMAGKTILATRQRGEWYGSGGINRAQARFLETEARKAGQAGPMGGGPSSLKQ